MNIGSGNVVVLVFVVSFAIDRLVTGLLFLLSYETSWNPLARFFRDPRTVEDGLMRIKAEKLATLFYFGLSFVFAVVLLAYFGDIRILKALGYPSSLDLIVTGIVLMGGADVLGKALETSGVGGKQSSPPRPIEITGKLILEEPKTNTTEPRTVVS